MFKISDKGIVIGFAVIGILTIIGIVSNTLYLVAAGAVFFMLAGMSLAYPAKLTAMLFGVLIIFTTSFLNTLSIYLGPFSVSVADMLQIWIFFLWLGAVIDGEGKPFSTSTGKIIISLSILSLVAFLRGVLAGFELDTSSILLKTMLGYLFFFPALWLLKKPENYKILLSSLLIASVIAAVWIILKGYIGGEGVYLRQNSGLRVSSREVNVVVIGLSLVAMLLWKKYKSLPLLPAILALLIMGAAILLGQSRALWLAVAAGALLAFIADMSRVGQGGFKIGRLFSRILLLLIFVAGSIAFVAVAGLLSASDIAARGGTADGGLSGDVSLWARFLSWWEIVRTVSASPIKLMFGMGFGYEITYFRPDMLMQVSIPYVDGSFFQLLLNQGLLGSLLLAWLYARGIAGSFSYAITSISRRDTILSLWLTASFTALTIAAFSGSLITNYRFTYIWAFMFAVLESIRRKKSQL